MNTFKSETEVTSECRIFSSRFGCKIFRNQVGKGKTLDGKRFIKFGLFPGSGDYIGWVSKKITQDMVGQKVAIFVSLEFKNEKWKLPKKIDEELEKQINWANTINHDGGIAGFVTCNEDLEELLK